MTLSLKLEQSFSRDSIFLLDSLTHDSLTHFMIVTHCGHVPVKRSHCTRNLTHRSHKANRPSRDQCTRLAIAPNKCCRDLFYMRIYATQLGA